MVSGGVWSERGSSYGLGNGGDSSVFRGLGDRMYVCECVFLSLPKWERGGAQVKN